jgi:hypothetical protein
MVRFARASPVLGVIMLLLTVLGTVGWSSEGVLEDIPAPPSADRAVFADEPLPEHRWTGVVTVEATVRWDRDDVWVAIVDEAEVERCANEPISAFFQRCVSTDLDAVAMGEAGTGEDGLTWVVRPGVHYAGYGSVEAPPDLSMDIEWEVHARLNGAATAMLLLISVGLFAVGVLERVHSTPS